MADNITLNAGTGGDTLAADDLGAGGKVQRVKLMLGADAVNDGDVASGNPLPISAASLPLPSGAATGGKQDTGNTSLASIDGKITAVNTGAVVISSGSVTADTELTTADLDTGAGTDTRAVVGLVVAASGGAANLSGNSGNKDGGTIRVVIATDQPALTNKLLVTPDSVALPANQSVNVAQVAGTTTSTNSGTKDAGTIRVVLATDQPALTNKLLVTPDSVALPSNQSVNVSQVNGVTPLMGNGVTGTGSMRVTIASDTTANSNPYLVTQRPATTGGLSIATGSIGATKTSVKGSAGQIFGWYIYNSNASVAYVQFFNAATGSVTLGSTAPDMSIGIPATSAANVEFGNGIAFSSQISIAITTTRAGSTGPGSTVDYNIYYA